MADYIVEIGPRAGKYGGELIRAEEVRNNQKKRSESRNQEINTDEGRQQACNLIDEFQIQPKSKPSSMGKTLTLKGATTNNLKKT